MLKENHRYLHSAATAALMAALLFLTLTPGRAKATTIAQFDAYTPTDKAALIKRIGDKMAADTRAADPALAKEIEDFLSGDDGPVCVIAQETKTKIAAMYAAD